MRKKFLGALLALSLAASPGFSRGADPACTGTLSGSVVGKFECKASVVSGDGDATYLVIAATTRVDGVPSLVPGSFDVTGLLRPGTYTLDQVGPGKASVAADGGTLYTATKTTGQRGELKLVFSTVRKDGKGAAPWEVHGTYRARLIPAGGGKTGEVVVEVQF
jgi:hypothetical protein